MFCVAVSISTRVNTYGNMDKRTQVINAVRASQSWLTENCVRFIETLPKIEKAENVVLPVSMLPLQKVVDVVFEGAS